MKIKSILQASVLATSTLAASTSLHATVFEFHFTGQFTLVDPSRNVLDQGAIDSTLTFDDVSGLGSSSGLSISNFDTFGNTATVYDISLQRVSNTSNLIVGNMLINWGSNIGMPISMIWNATGLFNAIDFGLQAGDVISGTNLKRNDVVIQNVNSATPASDGFTNFATGTTTNQGPAPLAVTTLNTQTICTPGVDCIGNALSGGGVGIDDFIAGSPMVDGPFTNLNVNFDIGSGNSLTVLSVSSVPVPAAAWLFGSGLIGLVGFARRKA